LHGVHSVSLFKETVASGIQRVHQFRGHGYTKYFNISAATDVLIRE